MSLKRPLDTPEKLIPDTKMNRFDILRDEADTPGTVPELSDNHPESVPMKEVDVDAQSATTSRCAAAIAISSSSAPSVRRELSLSSEELEDEDLPPRWFSKFTSRLESRFTSLEQHMEALVVEKFEKISLQVKANEESISACSIQIDEVVGEVKKLKREKEALEFKLDDLENRSRRQNLIFHGLPESPRENTQKLVEDLIRDFVGVKPSPEVPTITIERCHRTPTVATSDPKGAKSPRIVHVAFSTYVARELVRKACISKFKENAFQGHQIYVSEDFSKRVTAQRKGKLDKLKELRKEGKKPFFLYPARLAFRDPSGRLHIVG